ncbi:MAG: tRNA epoxyqueuosine(34) reductase QueG [Candidatus Melainabacteria bacterium]|nr:tRNA epoxyqueuosine(34) reductase QueG [Candidatus Melainabacteria bacterium]
MDLKQVISEFAHYLGFQRSTIGGLAPMESERVEFERWLAKGYAAGMGYLKRNPHFRTSPQLVYPSARSAIVVSVSYYSPVPPSPGLNFGRVARYAVGLDYHAVLKAKLGQLKAQLEAYLGRPLMGKAYTDDVSLFEHGYAVRHGLGFSGKNTLVIGPKMMGSYYFVAELFTDLEIDPDEPYRGTCGECFRCGGICPTSAIVEGYELNAGLCISYLTIENKGGIPLPLRPKIGEWILGCDLCQEVCPYNRQSTITPWQEFRPESGAGYYVDLFKLLEIKTDYEFRKRFASTPLRRPGRRGLIRNALVVLGNLRPDGAVEKIHRFAVSEPDPMLREHAAWAVAQYDDAKSNRVLELLYQQEPDANLKDQLLSYRNQR